METKQLKLVILGIPFAKQSARTGSDWPGIVRLSTTEGAFRDRSQRRQAQGFRAVFRYDEAGLDRQSYEGALRCDEWRGFSR